MPKIWINTGELFPLYEFTLDQPQRGIGAELSEEKLQEYNRIRDEYDAMQAELAELYDANEPETHPDHILSDDKKRILENIALIASGNSTFAKNGTDAAKWARLAEKAGDIAKLDVVTPELVKRIMEDYSRISREIEEESIP